MAGKSIDYNKPAFFCFKGLEKAFNSMLLDDIMHLLYDRDSNISEPLKRFTETIEYRQR